MDPVGDFLDKTKARPKFEIDLNLLGPWETDPSGGNRSVSVGKDTRHTHTQLF